jgi:hypothetical protein
MQNGYTLKVVPQYALRFMNQVNQRSVGTLQMTTVVRLRGIFGAAEKDSSSTSLYCDHCRERLSFCVHRYWRMRFCSAACMNAYQQRLSTHTQKKIYEIDGYHPSWKTAS